ncbi:MAG TPA: hypothetical protein VKE94_10480 [Gemmataceae bacterium]|nr:hypothetical protein [Gemmataceae bacterium]
MSRYLSLLGLLFLGVGALALASATKAAADEAQSLPDEAARNRTNRQLLLPETPSFHARFSLN